MTTAGAEVQRTSRAPLPGRGPTASLRIICPTYWYPQHATDTQATYVHDINRHLARRGHDVTVVTPGNSTMPDVDNFDGVKVVRFPLELPADLTYGRVAQSRVNVAGKVARLAVMAHYLEAQYRTTLNVAKAQGADVIHAHWAIPTGPAAVKAAQKLGLPSVITMHGGDVYVNPEQGYDFPTRWYVRPGPAVDPQSRGRPHRDHRRLPPARAPGRGTGRSRSTSFSTAPISAVSVPARCRRPAARATCITGPTWSSPAASSFPGRGSGSWSRRPPC